MPTEIQDANKLYFPNRVQHSNQLKVPSHINGLGEFPDPGNNFMLTRSGEIMLTRDGKNMNNR